MYHHVETKRYWRLWRLEIKQQNKAGILLNIVQSTSTMMNPTILSFLLIIVHCAVPARSFVPVATKSLSILVEKTKMNFISSSLPLAMSTTQTSAGPDIEVISQPDQAFLWIQGSFLLGNMGMWRKQIPVDVWFQWILLFIGRQGHSHPQRRPFIRYLWQGRLCHISSGYELHVGRVGTCSKAFYVFLISILSVRVFFLDNHSVITQ